MTDFCFFLKKLLHSDVDYIELFTREILNVQVEWIYPDGIIPDSGFSGLNNIYIYIYIYKESLNFRHAIYIYMHTFIYVYICMIFAIYYKIMFDLIIWFSLMKLDNFHHLEYSDNYFHQEILSIAYHLYPVMADGSRTIYPVGLRWGFGWRFFVGSWGRQERPEENLRAYRPKFCKYNDEDRSDKTTIYVVFCLDVAQGYTNWASNEI